MDLLQHSGLKSSTATGPHKRQYDRRFEQRARKNAARGLAIVWQSIALLLCGLPASWSRQRRALRQLAEGSTPSSCPTPSPRLHGEPACSFLPRGSPALVATGLDGALLFAYVSRALPCCTPSAVDDVCGLLLAAVYIGILLLGWVAIASPFSALASHGSLARSPATHGQPPNPDESIEN